MIISRLMLSETLKKLGPPGVVGVALLAFSVSLALSTLFPSLQERDLQRASAGAEQRNRREAAAQGMLLADSPADLAAQENQQEVAVRGPLWAASSADMSLILSMHLPSVPGLDRRRVSGATAHEPPRKVATRGTLRDDSPAAQLRAFYAIFPLQTDASEALSLLYAAAEEKNLQLLRGEYMLSGDRQTGLVLYRMTLPVHGGYSQIQEFVAAALKAVPALALDELSFERPKISDTQVAARIRLTLYLKLAS